MLDARDTALKNTPYRHASQSSQELLSVLTAQISEPVASTSPGSRLSDPSPGSLYRHIHFYSQVRSYAHQTLKSIALGLLIFPAALSICSS
jgi:hypothetical protein